MSKSRKSVSKRKGKVQSGGLKLLHEDMKALLELQKTQENKFVPEVADVPRLRFSPNQLVNVELSYMSTQNTNMTTPTYGSLAFSLASSTAYQNWTSCFDLYRIMQVNVKIFQTGIVSTQPLYTAIDYDDANAPSSPTALLSYDTLKMSFLNQIDERTLNPKFAIAAYAGATFNGYANASRATYIDAASPGVQYYGLKYYVPMTPAGAGTLNFVVTMMIQFKSQRSSS